MARIVLGTLPQKKMANLGWVREERVSYPTALTTSAIGRWQGRECRARNL